MRSTDNTGASGEYRLAIGRRGAGSPVSSQLYTLVSASEPQTRAYAVMEHQATNCAELPAAGHLALHDVKVSVGGHAEGDARHWTAMQHLPVCNARSAVAGGSITFTWQA